LRYVALVHLLGHACLRTLQFVRAPSMLRDRRALEDALGGRPGGPANVIPGISAGWLYRFALERAYLDGFLDTWVVGPFVKLFRWCDRVERGVTDAVNREEVRRTKDEGRNEETKRQAASVV